eukprot:tig00001669_g9559.t1
MEPVNFLNYGDLSREEIYYLAIANGSAATWGRCVPEAFNSDPSALSSSPSHFITNGLKLLLGTSGDQLLFVPFKKGQLSLCEASFGTLSLFDKLSASAPNAIQCITRSDMRIVKLVSAQSLRGGKPEREVIALTVAGHWVEIRFVLDEMSEAAAVNVGQSIVQFSESPPSWLQLEEIKRLLRSEGRVLFSVSPDSKSFAYFEAEYGQVCYVKGGGMASERWMGVQGLGDATCISSKNGGLVVLGTTTRKVVAIWFGQPGRTTSRYMTLPEQTGIAEHIVCSFDGSFAAVASAMAVTFVRLDKSVGLSIIPGCTFSFTSAVSSIALSPNCGLLVAFCKEGTVSCFVTGPAESDSRFRIKALEKELRVSEEQRAVVTYYYNALYITRTTEQAQMQKEMQEQLVEFQKEKAQLQKQMQEQLVAFQKEKAQLQKQMQEQLVAFQKEKAQLQEQVHARVVASHEHLQEQEEELWIQLRASGAEVGRLKARVAELEAVNAEKDANLAAQEERAAGPAAGPAARASAPRRESAATLRRNECVRRAQELGPVLRCFREAEAAKEAEAASKKAELARLVQEEVQKAAAVEKLASGKLAAKLAAACGFTATDDLAMGAAVDGALAAFGRLEEELAAAREEGQRLAARLPEDFVESLARAAAQAVRETSLATVRETLVREAKKRRRDEENEPPASEEPDASPSKEPHAPGLAPAPRPLQPTQQKAA